MHKTNVVCKLRRKNAVEKKNSIVRKVQKKTKVCHYEQRETWASRHQGGHISVPPPPPALFIATRRGEFLLFLIHTQNESKFMPTDSLYNLLHPTTQGLSNRKITAYYIAELFELCMSSSTK